MLQVISPLKGFSIEASDGRIGTVVDFLFDDASWKVRWLVIDCGTWLTGRKVLIHPSAISPEDRHSHVTQRRRTRAQRPGGVRGLDQRLRHGRSRIRRTTPRTPGERRETPGFMTGASTLALIF